MLYPIVNPKYFGAPFIRSKRLQKHYFEYNGRTKNAKKKQNGNIMGAHQIKRAQGKFFCPRIKCAPFIRYFRVYYISWFNIVKPTSAFPLSWRILNLPLASEVKSDIVYWFYLQAGCISKKDGERRAVRSMNRPGNVCRIFSWSSSQGFKKLLIKSR